jgi:hypothetical protein
MEQTILERQFHDVVVEGLCSEDNNTSHIWSILNAMKIEIISIIGSEDILYKELMHYIVEGDDPIDVFLYICKKIKGMSIEHVELRRFENIFKDRKMLQK